MWRFFYTCLSYLIQPFIVLFMLLRSLKSPNYRKRLRERYGFYANIPKPDPYGIIIHAASVGEVIAATPLVRKIQQNYPNLAITFTTVTPTGSERVKAAFGDKVTHIYLPYDVPISIKRFLNFIQPKLCIVIETELWPNLIHQLHSRQIPFVVANARLSMRSAHRYGKIKTHLQSMFEQISLIAAQDNVSGDRYLALGYDRQKLIVTGNIKYDLVVSPELTEHIQQLKSQWIADRPVWIAASTHEGEEEIILKAHGLLLAQYPNLLLLLVPRHPERFDSVGTLIQQQGFNFTRRSQCSLPDNLVQVMLGDTMGELMLLYGISDVAFVGGSLIKRGGHNPLEPLAFKLPIITGKYTFNFPEVFNSLLEVQGVLEVNSNAQTLSDAVAEFLNSAELRSRYGNAGYEVLIENRGALTRLLDVLTPYLEQKND